MVPIAVEVSDFEKERVTSCIRSGFPISAARVVNSLPFLNLKTPLVSLSHREATNFNRFKDERVEKNSCLFVQQKKAVEVGCRRT